MTVDICRGMPALSMDECVKSTIRFVVAHKPIYEVCEKTRLPYKRYTDTRFMNSLHKFLGNNGAYFCGDKHTRSIVRSSFHGINHYIG